MHNILAQYQYEEKGSLAVRELLATCRWNGSKTALDALS